MKILIDAGHGIETPGKRSPDGAFREYLWNRQVADLLQMRLEEGGYNASLVVTETNDISLTTRVNRINAVCKQEGKDNVIVVSIHANAAGDGKRWMKAKGWSCYTSPGKTESDTIAEYFYKAFETEFSNRSIRRDRSDGDNDWEANFYLLTKTHCPAVLLENFFYDNLEECAFLLRRETQVRIADAAYIAIIDYLQNERS